MNKKKSVKRSKIRKRKLLNKDNMICYTGIGSNKTGTHTEKEFLKIMKKTKDNFNEKPPKNIKTVDQWIKWSGATRGRCKTEKKPFKLSEKQMKLLCHKECKNQKKGFPKQLSLSLKLTGQKISKKKIKEAVKNFNKNCESGCVHALKEFQKHPEKYKELLGK